METIMSEINEALKDWKGFSIVRILGYYYFNYPIGTKRSTIDLVIKDIKIRTKYEIYLSARRFKFCENTENVQWGHPFVVI